MIGVYIPTRGRPWHGTAAALGEASPHYVHCNTGVSDARQMIVNHFLQSEAEICVMCDDDVVPPPDWSRICDHLIEGRADVCAAVVQIIVEGTVFLPNVFIRDDRLDKGYRLSNEFIRETGLQEVDAVGTGLIAIHRRVLSDRKLRDPFRVDFTKGAGEDVAFCRRAKQANWKVAVDFDIWCDHRVDVSANGVAEAYVRIINEGLGS